MKKALKIFGIVSALLLGTLVSLPYAFKAPITALVLKELDKNLNAKVSVVDVDLSFLRNFPNVSVGLTQLQIIGNGAFAGDTLARVANARAVVDIMSILKGDQYVIRKVILDKPDIHAVVHADGKANWDIVRTDTTKKSQDTTAASYSIDLKEYRINEGDIRYDDASIPMKAEIHALNHRGKGNFTESIYDLLTETEAAQVIVEYAGIRYLNKNKIKASVGLNMNSKQSVYQFLENEIMINDLPLTFSGMIALPDTNISMNLKFDSPKADLKSLLSLIPAVYKNDFNDLKAEGKVGFSGTVKGIYNAQSVPAIDLNVKAENGRFQYASLPTPVSNLQVDMRIQNPMGKDFDNLKVEVKKFTMDMGKNPVNIKGTFEGLSRIKINAIVKAKANLAELMQIYPIEGTDLKGLFDVDANIDGVYDTLAKTFPKVNAKIAMTNGFVKQKEYPVVLENINFNGTLVNTDGSLASSFLNIPQFHFDLDKKPFDGRATVKNFEKPDYDVQAKGTLDLAKVTQIFPIEGNILSGIFSIDGFAKGVYDAASNLLPKMDAKMSLTNGYIKNTQYNAELKNVSFNGTIQNPSGSMKDGKLDVDKFHFELDNAPMDGKAHIENFDSPKYDVSMNGTVDLDRVTQIYPLEGMKVGGKLFVENFNTKGSMADVEAERYMNLPTSGRVRMQNVKYEGADMGYPVTVTAGTADFTPSQLNLYGVSGMAGKSNYSLSGNLTNYLAYALLPNEALGGTINFTSPKLNVNEFMGSDISAPQEAAPSEAGELSVIEIPSNLNVLLNADLAEVIYDNLSLKGVKGQIGVANHAMSMRQVNFSTLGGNFTLNGIYDTHNAKRPLFGMDVDVRNLTAKEAYKYFSTFRKFAPIAQHIEGKLNTQIKITGELKENMMPILENVSGLGVFEMLEAKLTGAPVLGKIAEKTKIEEFKDIALKGAKSQFEIKNGFVEIKPFDIKVPQKDLNLNVGGRQGIAGNLDYLVKIDAPFGKLGQAAQATLGKLPGLGTKLPERIKVNVSVGGTYAQPQITNVALEGGPGGPIQQQIEQKLEEKAQDIIKDKTGIDVPLNKDSLKQKAEEIKDRALDKAQEEIEAWKKKQEEEAKKRAEEAKKKAEEAKKRIEDSIKKALDKLKGGGFPFPKK